MCKKYIVLILIFIAVSYSSCKNTVIEGKVFDGFGNPIEDATVKVDGTQFITQTDRDGEYSVKYVPGDIRVLISKHGFTDTSFTVKIAAESIFPAQAMTIYEIPTSDGVFLINNGKYTKLNKGNVSIQKFVMRSDLWEMDLEYDYTISFNPENVTSINKQKTEILLLDHDPRSLTLLKIQNTNGRSGTMLKRNMRNVERSDRGEEIAASAGFYKDVAIVPYCEYTELNAPHCGLRHYKLDVGDYAIIQYPKQKTTVLGEAFVLRVTN